MSQSSGGTAPRVELHELLDRFEQDIDDAYRRRRRRQCSREDFGEGYVAALVARGLAGLRSMPAGPGDGEAPDSET